MPRIVSILFAVVCASVGVAACSNNGSTTATPTVGPTPTATPDKQVHTAVLQVTVAGTPTVNVPVAISVPANKTDPRPGKTFRTVKTGADGVARFDHLNYLQTYCWVATLSASHIAWRCAGPTVWEFTDPLTLGT